MCAMYICYFHVACSETSFTKNCCGWNLLKNVGSTIIKKDKLICDRLLLYIMWRTREILPHFWNLKCADNHGKATQKFSYLQTNRNCLTRQYHTFFSFEAHMVLPNIFEYHIQDAASRMTGSSEYGQKLNNYQGEVLFASGHSNNIYGDSPENYVSKAILASSIMSEKILHSPSHCYTSWCAIQPPSAQPTETTCPQRTSFIY